MLILFMIPIFLSLCFTIDAPKYLADFAAPIHRACQALAPQSAESENYRAIVCGSPLKVSDFKTGLARSGLLHLIVVSGSHLIALEALLSASSRRYPWLNRLLIPVLLVFTAANRFEPVVIRALAYWIFSRLNERWNLFWRKTFLVSIAGLFAFAFCENHFQVLGLLMSWTCSLTVAVLALNFTRTGNPTKSVNAIFLRHCMIYLLIAPVMIQVSVPHPLSILTNLALAPFFGAFLFPVSLAALAIPWLSELTDWIWRFTEALIQTVAAFIPEGAQKTPVSLHWLALYLVFLTAVAWREEHQCAGS